MKNKNKIIFIPPRETHLTDAQELNLSTI